MEKFNKSKKIIKSAKINSNNNSNKKKRERKKNGSKIKSQ